ncbi:MAG TPA: flavodoxin domain-containing protein [Acidimicrobiia bacterium]|nr:flavodoxin domain-containing protein [Acidimicrobiia bacterium]
MNTVVIYESMYGNTHLIAEAIAGGLRDANADVTVVPVSDAREEMLDAADLVVVGGPTHAHGMSRAGTRDAAVKARDRDPDLVLDPDAEGEGLREWFASVGRVPARAAAFDTRFDMPAALTGRASRGIARRLRAHGSGMIADPESFFVTRQNHLEPEEATRARDWGKHLAAAMTDVPATG